MTKDWRRLADAVVRRRAELGKLTQAEIAERGGISLDRVQAIEGAKRSSYRRSTLMGLETGLEWLRGSVDEVLAGGDPTPLPRSGPPGGPSNEDLIASARRKLAELRADLDRLETDDRNRAAAMTLIAGLEAMIGDHRQ